MAYYRSYSKIIFFILINKSLSLTSILIENNKLAWYFCLYFSLALKGSIKQPSASINPVTKLGLRLNYRLLSLV